MFVATSKSVIKETPMNELRATNSATKFPRLQHGGIRNRKGHSMKPVRGAALITSSWLSSSLNSCMSVICHHGGSKMEPRLRPGGWPRLLRDACRLRLSGTTVTRRWPDDAIRRRHQMARGEVVGFLRKSFLRSSQIGEELYVFIKS